MDNQITSKKIEKALLKRAIGYSQKEITEEYQINEGESVLVKKKVSLKKIPPDISAAKLLMDAFCKAEKNIMEFSDEELIAEKSRLVNLLKEEKENESD